MKHLVTATAMAMGTVLALPAASHADQLITQPFSADSADSGDSYLR
jgi:hypothetical protein